MNEDNAQPVVDESVTQELQEETPETQVEEVEAQHEPNETEVTEPTTQEETQEIKPQALESSEEEDEGLGFDLPQQPEIPEIDVQQFIDAEGGFDAVGYNQAMQQQVAQAAQAAVQQATSIVKAEAQYEKLWQDAYKDFPELKGSKDLKDMVQAIHANSANPGFKYLTPKKAAEKLFGVRSQAKAEGMKAAQESRQVQASANLGASTPPAEVRSNKADSLKEQMRYGKSSIERQGAATGLIAEMLRQGKI